MFPYFPALISRQMKNNTDKNSPTLGTIPVNYFYILYYVNIWYTLKSKFIVIIYYYYYDYDYLYYYYYYLVIYLLYEYSYLFSKKKKIIPQFIVKNIYYNKYLYYVTNGKIYNGLFSELLKHVLTTWK